MMQCPQCGNEVFPGDPFCDNCGADLRNLQAAPPPLPAAPAAPPPAQPPVVPFQPEAAASPPVTPQPATPQAQPPAFAPPPAPQPAIPQPAGAGPRLVVKDTGAVCPLPSGRDLTIGRTDPIDGIFPDVDLTPYDTLTGVSRRHARLHEQGGQWFLRDLNSTNYTVVNRQRLQPDQDFLIEPGDELRFGRLTMIFQV